VFDSGPGRVVLVLEKVGQIYVFLQVHQLALAIFILVILRTLSFTIGTLQCGLLLSSLNKHLLNNEYNRVFVTAGNSSAEEGQRPGTVST